MQFILVILILVGGFFGFSAYSMVSDIESKTYNVCKKRIDNVERCSCVSSTYVKELGRGTKEDLVIKILSSNISDDDKRRAITMTFKNCDITNYRYPKKGQKLFDDIFWLQ